MRVIRTIRRFVPLVLTLCVGPLSALPASADSQTFDFSGTSQTWTVPAGVTQATFDVFGAQGGAGVVQLFSGISVQPSVGGAGGHATATLPVTPGDTYLIAVGGAGGDAVCCTPRVGGVPGFNGGGRGGGNPTSPRRPDRLWPGPRA